MMSDVHSVLADFARRGIRLIPSPPNVIVEPASLLTDEDRQAIRQRKAELLAVLTPQPDSTPADPASQALAITRRLKTYVLPTGRIPAAKVIVERLRPLLDGQLDIAEALPALRVVEAELKAQGAQPDPELAAAVELVNGTFQTARLVKV